MWISVPTPETTSIIVVESESTRNVQSSSSVPMWIHSAKARQRIDFAVILPKRDQGNKHTETTNAAPDARLATVPINLLAEPCSQNDIDQQDR
jgi:hypothetical protein